MSSCMESARRMLVNSQIPVPLNQIEINTLIQQARAERAIAAAVLLASIPSLLKRLTAKLRPNRQRLPQTGAWA